VHTTGWEIKINKLVNKNLPPETCSSVRGVSTYHERVFWKMPALWHATRGEKDKNSEKD
jgi:hypothetical protein